MSSALSILSDETSLLSQEGSLFRSIWNARTKSNVAQPAYLALARAGDEDALAHFYEEFKEPTWRLCRRLLRREADAEDVLQTTFIKAFAALPKFRGDASLKTWLFRIAVNEATTVLRRRESVGDTDDAANTDLLRETAGISDAERLAIRELIGDMKPEFRTVLVLRYWEELSYDEIAEVLGVAMPSVKMRLHRAKEAFRVLYTKEEIA